MPDPKLLLSPLTLGAHQVKNRIVSTAHGEHMGSGGLMTRELVDYHTQRAEGGVGLMVVFGSGTVYPASDNAGNISLWDRRNEGYLHELAARVRSHGTVLLAQATHRGPRETPSSPDAWTAAPSPSPGALPHGSPHVLTSPEIADIVDHYGRAAARLAQCGFSGVEITGLGSHLMELFWSPATNRRDDAYGGSLENRMRLTREIVASVAAAVPNDFLLSFRLSADPQSPSLGLSSDDMLEIVSHIDDLGRVDVFSVSGGSGVNIETHAGNVPTEAYPTSTYTALSKAVKGVTDTPVVVAGRILTADTAEQALADGSADLVGMTRALIAEPTLPQRIMEAREDRARPCIAINEGCRLVVSGRRLACTVNPEIATPSLRLIPSATSRRIAIVGGGPAGLEAARVAAERGHEVTIFEQADSLGGQVVTAALDPERPHLRRHVDWSVRELEHLGVKVQLGVRADVTVVDDAAFDAIVVAAGSRPILPPDLDPELITAVTDVDLLTNPTLDFAGRPVTVFDTQGHRRGVSAAVWLARRSPAPVRLATPFLEALETLEKPNKPPLLRQLAAARVQVLTSHEINFDRGRPQLRHLWSDDEVSLDADDVLVSVGWTDVDNALSERLRAQFRELPVHVIGDALAPRLLRNAISEGAKIGAQV